jgi:hypothetical protein
VTHKVKPLAEIENARELIAEVDAYDRRQARLAIRGGVQVAREQWIAVPVVAEVMALELIGGVQENHSGEEAAIFLMALAGILNQEAEMASHEEHSGYGGTSAADEYATFFKANAQEDEDGMSEVIRAFSGHIKGTA